MGNSASAAGFASAAIPNDQLEVLVRRAVANPDGATLLAQMYNDTSLARMPALDKATVFGQAVQAVMKSPQFTALGHVYTDVIGYFMDSATTRENLELNKRLYSFVELALLYDDRTAIAKAIDLANNDNTLYGWRNWSQSGKRVYDVVEIALHCVMTPNIAALHDIVQRKAAALERKRVYEETGRRLLDDETWTQINNAALLVWARQQVQHGNEAAGALGTELMDCLTAHPDQQDNTSLREAYAAAVLKGFGDVAGFLQTFLKPGPLNPMALLEENDLEVLLAACRFGLLGPVQYMLGDRANWEGTSNRYTERMFARAIGAAVQNNHTTVTAWLLQKMETETDAKDTIQHAEVRIQRDFTAVLENPALLQMLLRAGMPLDSAGYSLPWQAYKSRDKSPAHREVWELMVSALSPKGHQMIAIRDTCRKLRRRGELLDRRERALLLNTSTGIWGKHQILKKAARGDQRAIFTAVLEQLFAPSSADIPELVSEFVYILSWEELTLPIIKTMWEAIAKRLDGDTDALKECITTLLVAVVANRNHGHKTAAPVLNPDIVAIYHFLFAEAAKLLTRNPKSLQQMAWKVLNACLAHQAEIQERVKQKQEEADSRARSQTLTGAEIVQQRKKALRRKIKLASVADIPPVLWEAIVKSYRGFTRELMKAVFDTKPLHVYAVHELLKTAPDPGVVYAIVPPDAMFTAVFNQQKLEPTPTSTGRIVATLQLILHQCGDGAGRTVAIVEKSAMTLDQLWVSDAVFAFVANQFLVAKFGASPEDARAMQSYAQNLLDATIRNGFFTKAAWLTTRFPDADYFTFNVDTMFAAFYSDAKTMVAQTTVLRRALASPGVRGAKTPLVQIKHVKKWLRMANSIEPYDVVSLDGGPMSNIVIDALTQPNFNEATAEAAAEGLGAIFDAYFHLVQKCSQDQEAMRILIETLKPSFEGAALQFWTRWALLGFAPKLITEEEEEEASDDDGVEESKDDVGESESKEAESAASVAAPGVQTDYDRLLETRAYVQRIIDRETNRVEDLNSDWDPTDYSDAPPSYVIAKGWTPEAAEDKRQQYYEALAAYDRARLTFIDVITETVTEIPMPDAQREYIQEDLQNLRQAVNALNTAMRAYRPYLRIQHAQEARIQERFLGIKAANHTRFDRDYIGADRDGEEAHDAALRQATAAVHEDGGSDGGSNAFAAAFREDADAVSDSDSGSDSDSDADSDADGDYDAMASKRTGARRRLFED